MAGISGLYLIDGEQKKVFNSVHQMGEMTVHKSFYVSDPAFVNDRFGCMQVHSCAMAKVRQPASGDRAWVWLEGEIYNRKELLANPPECDASLLLELYLQGRCFDFLKQVDGSFAGVVYDEEEQVIHLISDRFTRQQLFWTIFDGGLAWSSELKSLTKVPGFHAQIDPAAVEQFSSAGYLLGEQSWFKSVYLIPAASVLTYSIPDHKITRKRYWWWDQVKPLQGKLEINELAEEAGRLFTRAVENLSEMNPGQVGVTLSGGRDSRAIFAAMPEKYGPITAVTFGTDHSRDIQIARKVTKKKPCRHVIHFLNEKNWFNRRVEGVWWTDGQVSLENFHGSSTQIDVRELFEVSFNGLPGELLAGKAKAFEMDSAREYIQRAFKGFSAEMQFRLEEYIKSMECPEVYGLNHRLRNFGLLGVKQGDASGVRVRLPFADKELSEFAYSVPYSLRKDCKLYDTMLLMFFPDYFTDIKWYDLEIKPEIRNRIIHFADRAGNHFHYRKARMGFGHKLTMKLHNLECWIRSDEMVALLQETLFGKEAVYPDYMPLERVVNCFEACMRGEPRESELLRYLTMEIWFRQLFYGSHRKTKTVGKTAAVLV